MDSAWCSFVMPSATTSTSVSTLAHEYAKTGPAVSVAGYHAIHPVVAVLEAIFGRPTLKWSWTAELVDKTVIPLLFITAITSIVSVGYGSGPMGNCAVLRIFETSVLDLVANPRNTRLAWW
ncbi:hypothetical protein OGAPHI_005786 [Ogataea philodendri]|uniref:Uncharacterized protein n=1 Tax=Ogataea philodendri TaxID=1378263 RepID=A0A9P8P0P9_9ASCO|nr:uncharacterized protein OGAPHI_005786 [Ogataea philodendri]KAH3662534.1 hypothetical protein OGAPHI_005786 [Ogataea philodendri]